MVIVMLCCCRVVRGARGGFHQCPCSAVVCVAVDNRYSQVRRKTAGDAEETRGCRFFITEHCQGDARWTLAIDNHWRVDMPTAGVCGT